jgi:hypothetical protein
MLLGAIGCGDDEKPTNGDNQNVLGDTATVNWVVLSLSDDQGNSTLGLVQGAISSAVSDFKGYDIPDIDDMTGGFGKIAVPQTYSYRYENGWHIFLADETFTNEINGLPWDWDFEIADSVRLEKDGVPDSLLPDPDYVDMRTHIDLGLVEHTEYDENYYDISLYRHGVLSLKPSMELWIDLDESFDLNIDIDSRIHPTRVSLATPTDDRLKIRYVYDIVVDDLVLIEADDYNCPTSGTIDMTVSVYVTDGTNTLTGSAQVHLVITPGGNVTGTVTSGDYVVVFTDTDFCADASSLPDNSWVRFLSM